MTLLALIFLIMGGVLIYRCFDLQIVHGSEYLENFMMEIEKTRDIPGSRGNIYDRNGNLLAYNELVYSVKLEDVFESGKQKNKQLNSMIESLIKMIEKNGDHCVSDFKIFLNEDGEFEFNVEGNSLKRFLADVYGHSYVEQLKDSEKNSTAYEVMEYLSGKDNFAIGDYAESENTDSDFIPGKGYTRSEWLKIATIRYNMFLISYRKYIGTTVASNVNERTVAVIMENSADLPGVTIEEDTIRKYVDSEYFAHILGYTGKISSDEMTSLNAKVLEEEGVENAYSINDVVGKSGIESYMETTLQGKKGTEKVIVNNVGKVITILESTEAESGQDVYLTIDKDLTIAVYNIVEQKLAGLVASKIINAKEYKPNAAAESSDIKIPIYEVYFAAINNSIIDVKHFLAEDAKETEKEVYSAFLTYKASVYERLRSELTERSTPYNKLDVEYQVYQTNLVNLLEKSGVLITDAIDTSDATYQAWVIDETISLREYLRYCISMNWIDVTRLSLDDKYSDSDEIYEKLSDYIIALIDKNTDFQKKFYKYMLLKDVIDGKQICMILCEQDQINISETDRAKLYNGRLSAYQFMMNRINNLDITPGELALDPCNASVVITDVNSGAVLAMVTYPGYDNNKMANSVDAEYFEKLRNDKANSMLNFATQYKAAPGSTFKMVVASAGLMEKVISTTDKVNCVGTFREVTPSPKCWYVYGHGNENVVTALRDSCNYFFYNVGYMLSQKEGVYNEDLGLNKLYQYADLFGLSSKSGVEVSEYEPDISDFDPVRSSIGQGRNSYTTSQLVRYISTIANNGNCYDLTLLDRVTDSSGKVITKFESRLRNTVEMPAEYWNAIHSGMRLVVQSKSYFNSFPISVAGKTGTADQVNSRPPHALFVCYAPYENPEIAVATRIPFGYSSDYTAQITRDIIGYYYHLDDMEDVITGTADRPESGISNER